MRYLMLLLFTVTTFSLQAAGSLLVTKKMLMEQLKSASSIPTWVVVLVLGVVLLFTILLVFAPIGSNKRRGRKRTILR